MIALIKGYLFSYYLLPFKKILLFGQAVLATELDLIMQSNQTTKNEPCYLQLRPVSICC